MSKFSLHSFAISNRIRSNAIYDAPILGWFFPCPRVSKSSLPKYSQVGTRQLTIQDELPIVSTSSKCRLFGSSKNCQPIYGRGHSLVVMETDKLMIDFILQECVMSPITILPGIRARAPGKLFRWPPPFVVLILRCLRRTVSRRRRDFFRFCCVFFKRIS